MSVTHGPSHSPEEMKAHANEVVGTNFDELGPVEKSEYTTALNSIRNKTGIEANKLRLTIYANILDVNDVADSINESTWILENVQATQILINTIQPGALALEDDIYGPATMRCVKAIFGLDIPVPGVDSAVTVSATVSSVFAAEDILEMRRTILSDSTLRTEVEKMGVRFVEQDDGEVEMILPDGFENTVEYRQLQTYIKALHMTTDPEYTSESITDPQRQEKMEMFLEITRGSGDHILGREYLGYKLINSINEDLKRDPSGPYIMTRSGEQGEYGIFIIPITRDDDFNVTTSRARPDLPYHKLLEAGTIDDDYIDFANTYSLIEHNPLAFKGKEFFGQATLVKTILENHHINGVSEEDIQDGNLLLADWDLIVEQIDTKMTALSSNISQNAEAYKELLYVKDLIEGKQWMSQERNTAIFREINTFGKVFLALEGKALIDDRVGLLDGGGVGEETPGEMIRNIIKENVFGLPGVLALFIAIFNIGGLGKAAGMGLLGAAFGMAAGSIVDSVGDRTPASNTADQLEIVRMRELRYNIKGGETVNSVLTNLYAENDSRSNDSMTTADRKLFVQEPLVLGKILFEVSESDELSTLDLADNDIATKIFTQMSADGKLTVTGDEFTSRVTSNPTVKQEDVNAFIEILRNQSDDSVDTTLGDLLIAGDIDRLNHNYDSTWYSLTENGEVNTEFHQQFVLLWGTNNTPRARDKRKDIQSILEKFDELLFSGAGDAANTAWGNAGSVTGGAGAAIGALTGVSVDEKKQKINELEAYINTNAALAAAPIIRQGLLDTLNNYTILLEKQEDFKNLTDSWYETSAGTRVRFQTITAWLRGQEENDINLENLRIGIGTDITSLNALLLSLPAGNIFDNLKVNIQKEINQLQITEQRIIGALKSNAIVSSVMDSAGNPIEDIDDSLGLGKVTHVVTELQGQLRDSIDLSIETSLFGINESDLKAAIIGGYQKVIDQTGNTINSSANIGINQWNNFRGLIQDSLASALAGSVVSDIIGTINPIGTLPPANVVIVNGAPNRATIDQITAQIQLQILERYFADQEANLANMQKLRDAYLPKITGIEGGGGTLTPEQERLKELITTDYDALLVDIEAKVKDLADNYEGAAISTAINDLDVSATAASLTSANLDSFEEITQFLSTSDSNDVQITFLQNQINRHFGTTNSLDGILVPSTTLRMNFETKKDELREYVETTGILEYDATQTYTVTQVNDNITKLETLTSILGVPTTVLDTKVADWNTHLEAIATLGNIEHAGITLTSALTDDIATLNRVKTSFDAAGIAPTEDKYLVVVELLGILTNASVAPGTNYQTFKTNIQTATVRGSITLPVWSQISTGTLEGEAIKTVNILNNN